MGMEEIEKKGWKNCASRRIITLEMLQKWLELAIKHSYVRVGNDGVLKQEVGIPQGMNASPWISNLYLYMYELRFMRQFMEGTDADKAFFLENFKYFAKANSKKTISSKNLRPEQRRKERRITKERSTASTKATTGRNTNITSGGSSSHGDGMDDNDHE